MARPLRLDQARGWYHVFSRGIERRVIFPANDDREDFLERLGELPKRFAVAVHAYVLMGNHYHLLLRPQNLNLSKAVQWLNVGYSIQFNKKHRRIGPLFQGRFKSILIGEEAQLGEITRYLHLNPVRIREFGLDYSSRKKLEEGLGKALPVETIQGAIRHLNAYRWSSYRNYAGLASKSDWLQVTLPGTMGSKEYRRYVEMGIRLGMPENLFQENIIEGFLGSREKFQELKKKLGKFKADRREQKGARQMEGLLPWERIVEAVEKVEGLDWRRLCLIRGNPGRDLALVLGRTHGGLSLKEVGEKTGGMSYPAVAQAVNRMEERLKKEKPLKGKMLRLVEMSNVET